MVTPEQRLDIAAALVQGVPVDLPRGLAQAWIGCKSLLHQTERLMLLLGPGILPLLEEKLSSRTRITCYDQLAFYRQIEGLIVIGPAELDKACRTPNGQNPLGLKDGWIPNIPVPEDLDKWIRSCVWRDHKDWQTRAALVLVPPEIAGISTSLIGQQKIWGVSHDNIDPGVVRQDVFWSNWFVKPNYDWANSPAMADWQWVLIYEHPLWTTNLNWKNQQKVVTKRKMLLSNIAQDALALNLILAATGIRFRNLTYSRTSTIFDGYPLGVNSGGRGVDLRQGWDLEDADGHVAASVQGVSLDFVA